MTQTIRIYQGLPASGKSTLTKELAERGWKRVNKDTLRLEHLGGFTGTEADERRIHMISRLMIEGFLRQGYSVVVDDMNFGKNIRELSKLARRVNPNIVIEVEFLDVDPEECILRNTLRPEGERVPEDVIWKQWNRYAKHLRALKERTGGRHA